MYHSINSGRPSSLKAMIAETEGLQGVGLDNNTDSVTVLQDMFIVEDLLEGYSYRIARSQSGYQVTFALKDGSQVVVAVEPDGDITLVAQRIAGRLMEAGNRILRLGYNGSLDSTGGV